MESYDWIHSTAFQAYSHRRAWGDADLLPALGGETDWWGEADLLPALADLPASTDNFSNLEKSPVDAGGPTKAAPLPPFLLSLPCGIPPQSCKVPTCPLHTSPTKKIWLRGWVLSFWSALVYHYACSLNILFLTIIKCYGIVGFCITYLSHNGNLMVALLHINMLNWPSNARCYGTLTFNLSTVNLGFFGYLTTQSLVPIFLSVCRNQLNPKISLCKGWPYNDYHWYIHFKGIGTLGRCW